MAAQSGQLADITSPDVEYCGYSAPHPSEDKIHLRIQMYDSLSAVDCLRKALGNLRDLFVSIQTKYSESLAYVCSLQLAPLFHPGASVACSFGMAAAHGDECEDARLQGCTGSKAIARPTRRS
jgi:hypothetical protein